jgi:hypothetical protein
MTIPTWHDVKKTTAYKEGFREVEALIRRMTLSYEQRLGALSAALSEQGDSIVALEAEVAALKAQPIEAAVARDETGRIDEGVRKANGGNV